MANRKYHKKRSGRPEEAPPGAEAAAPAGAGRTIQWFPGHMAKTRRKMQESLPLVDVVIELVDARIPAGSRNPDLDKLAAAKPRVVLLNKADIADDAATARWIDALKREAGSSPFAALAVDCKSGRGLGAFMPAVRQVLAPRIAAWQEKGMTGRAIRMLVAGVPNSGKSSFINRLAKGGKARVEDRPGVTRGNQWYTAADGSLLLDTPGVLWPKFEDQEVARHLAYTGAIRDEVLDPEELACGLLDILASGYASLLVDRYGLEEPLPDDRWELLEMIARRRGMLVSGGAANTERAAIMLLDEFRGGVIGRVTLEEPA